MTISSINLSRVSQNLRTDVVLGALRRNQIDFFNAQQRVSSGRAFVTPSDDPFAAARTLDLTQALDRQLQLARNLTSADGVLMAADGAMTQVNEMLNEAHTIALQNLSSLTSAAERSAAAEIIASIRDGLQIIGNREYNGRFLFAGRDTQRRPFISALGGIAYVGDTGELIARVEEGQTASVSVPGNTLFGALTSRFGSTVDLDPILTSNTRLEDLRGSRGLGVQPGQLVINEADGVGTFSVDLTSADTIGDVVDMINAAAATAGSGLAATSTSTGIDVTPGGRAVTIVDTGTGTIAADLGILAVDPTSDTISGGDLDAKLTRLTPLAGLATGAGVDLDGGFVITNGSATATIDLSGAETVQDLINRINNADVFVFARVNDAGRGIELINQVSGTSVTVGENGGTTAADFGIRSMDRSTRLDQLNFGLGVTMMEGESDLQVIATDGGTFDVNLDTAQTIGDVIDLLNAAATAASVPVTASLATVGNGIHLTDAARGDGDLTVSGMNLSAAAQDLGFDIAVAADSAELLAGDVNPQRTDGVLDALLRLEAALRGDDTAGISLATERLGELTGEISRVHGIVGARSRSIRSRIDQMQSATAVSRTLLSEVSDLDFTEAITRLQTTQLQLQATMQTSSQLLSLSLMDFLG